MESETRLKSLDDKNQHREVNLIFKDIRYSVQLKNDQQCCHLPCRHEPQKKQILKGISGIAKAGQVTAIMGASGAGKTTLLSILACRIGISNKNYQKGKASGKILANNTEYSGSNFGDFANYVMQTDTFMGTLTVTETLDFVSTMKLGIPSKERKQLVSQLIKDLKLQSCKDTLVGDHIMKGVSGGEKKRTSIGFQLISNPSVVILDEPTSGLDSMTAYIIIRYLSKLAREQKKTILMTIHQPNSEIFSMFDRLILMVGGHLIYQGQANKAIHYFRDMGFSCPQFSNPPDYFMSIIHEQSSTNTQNYPKYFETYQKIMAPQVQRQCAKVKTSPVLKRRQQASACQKMGGMLKRDFIHMLRNPLLLLARLFQSIFLSILVGGAYFQIDRFDNYIVENELGENVAGVDFYTLSGFMFFICIVSIFGNMAPGAVLFPKEKLIFMKQEGSRVYSTFMFFLSRNIIQFPLLVVSTLIEAAIVYWMVGLAPTAEQFFIFYAILLITGFVGGALGLLTGSVVSDLTIVPILAPMFLLPLFVLSGFFKNRQDLPDWIGWVQYISFFKYPFIAFMKNQFDEYDDSIQDNKQPLSFLSFDGEFSLVECIGTFIGLGFFFRLLSLLVLYLKRSNLQ